MSLNYPLSCCFVLFRFQKESFCISKGFLLVCKCTPFGEQKESFYKPKGVHFYRSCFLLEILKLRFVALFQIHLALNGSDSYRYSCHCVYNYDCQSKVLKNRPFCKKNVCLHRQTTDVRQRAKHYCIDRRPYRGKQVTA